MLLADSLRAFLSQPAALPDVPTQLKLGYRFADGRRRRLGCLGKLFQAPGAVEGSQDEHFEFRESFGRAHLAQGDPSQDLNSVCSTRLGNVLVSRMK